MIRKTVERYGIGEEIPANAVFIFFDGMNEEQPLLYEVPVKNEAKAKSDGSSDIIEAVISHLNETIGSKYTSRAAATKKVIQARINEGRTLEDFKAVINTKFAEWGEDPFWAKYLRPETLFGSKFDGYLSQPCPADQAEVAFAELDAHLGTIK